jgi:hypothetical protein
MDSLRLMGYKTTGPGWNRLVSGSGILAGVASGQASSTGTAGEAAGSSGARGAREQKGPRHWEGDSGAGCEGWAVGWE